ncbi:MAG: hypothetical protein AB7O67_06020 [Vicinamibacterales bacterium]
MIRPVLTFVAGLALAAPVTAFAQAPAAQQVASAVLAAPAELREGAGVLGYDASGKIVTLRESKNDLLCLADNPENEGFEVDCYHKDLEPYMARGRQLREQGITGKASYDVRWKEVEDGTLKMAREPRPLYILTGKSYDPATQAVQDEYRRWVFYWPFATAESTGLSTKNQMGTPWLMYPGTAGAHIMISPPKQ